MEPPPKERLKDYFITIDAPRDAIFMPNQEVNAVFHLEVTEPVILNSCKVYLVRNSITMWNISGEKTITAGGNKTCVDKECVLWDEEKEVPVGKNKYPFKFVIPSTALPTLKLQNGNEMKYYFRAVMEIKGEEKTREITENIQIGGWSLDLNDDTKLAYKYPNEVSKTFTKWFVCESDPLVLKASVPQTGYAAGENIAVTVVIDNNKAGKLVKSLEYGIKEDKVFIDDKQTHSKIYQINVVKELVTVHQKVNSKSNEPIVCNMKVPDVLPTLESKIICVSYHVYVKLHVGCFFEKSDSVELLLPLVIGTVPIKKAANASNANVSNVAAIITKGNVQKSNAENQKAIVLEEREERVTKEKKCVASAVLGNINCEGITTLSVYDK